MLPLRPTALAIPRRATWTKQQQGLHFQCPVQRRPLPFFKSRTFRLRLAEVLGMLQEGHCGAHVEAVERELQVSEHDCTVLQRLRRIELVELRGTAVLITEQAHRVVRSLPSSDSD